MMVLIDEAGPVNIIYGGGGGGGGYIALWKSKPLYNK